MTRRDRTFRTTAARAACAAFVAALACSGAARASADVAPMLELDERLEMRPVDVVSVGEETFEEFTSRGRVRSRSHAGVLALLPRAWEEADAGPPARDEGGQPWIALVDGQRIVGRPGEPSSREDVVTWRHETLGVLAFPLEDVLRIALDGRAGGAAPDGADDVVLLRNGDRLAGFVTRVQPEIVIESDGRDLTIPLNLAARVDLVNEPVRPRGRHIWLHDSTRIAFHSLGRPPSGEVALHIEAPSESPLSEARAVPLHEVAAIAFDAGRLVPLTDLPVERSGPDVSRRTGSPPHALAAPGAPLAAGDVALPGPMHVEWTLPAGSLRLAGWAALPEEARLWGDCEVTVEALDASGAAVEVAQARLHGGAPAARINAPLPEGAVRLRIRSAPGEYGPVQDHVVLRRFIVLTGGGPGQ